MDRNGSQLEVQLNYYGMQRAARELAMKDKLAKPEELAVMTMVDVCDLIMEKYEMVMYDSEAVLLIPKDKMKEFNEMAIWLQR